MLLNTYQNEDEETMDKNNRIDFFRQLTAYLSEYTNDEIENGIIAYFLSKLGYSDNENTFVLLKEKAQKTIGEIEVIFNKNDFPIDIEILIEFFEYLLEQNEKTENGVVFTPKYISDYISGDLLGNISEWNECIKIIDPGCGCGIFLISVIEEIHNKFGVGIVEIIENNIYGIDVMNDNIRRCRYILQIYCLMNGICLKSINDNLVCADSLSSDWSSLFNTGENFDYVIGNPPYVNTHDMSKSTISFLKKTFSTTKAGVFNIFYAFVEHGLKQLAPNGYLEFIVPNNFLKIKSAENLRELLLKGENVCSILDFADNMVFKPVRTYNCIIKLSNLRQEKVSYFVMDKSDDIQKSLSNISFNKFQTAARDKNGWILVDEKTRENIARIEGQKYPIKDYIRTGIATLRDGIYLVEAANNEYYKIVDGDKYHIESEIVKPIYKIPELKNCVNAREASQYIIFPYVKGTKGYELIPENELCEKFSNTYSYLLAMKPVLDQRDKGKGNFAAWYAYGRTQGLNKYGRKLLFPTFSNHPNFIYIDDEDALFCNGYAVFENEQFPLIVLAKILNSSIMDYYISNTSYSIEGGYYCYQKRYIERFSIPEFNTDEIDLIITGQQQDVNELLQNKYQLLM